MASIIFIVDMFFSIRILHLQRLSVVFFNSYKFPFFLPFVMWQIAPMLGMPNPVKFSSLYFHVQFGHTNWLAVGYWIRRRQPIERYIYPLLYICIYFEILFQFLLVYIYNNNPRVQPLLRSIRNSSDKWSSIIFRQAYVHFKKSKIITFVPSFISKYIGYAYKRPAWCIQIECTNNAL